ncbi:MAG: ribosome-associated translation inhibitor RaiA [Rhizobiales bacterium]|nr:ribosome-associated translation inhibitor RaiA [Hyphomicrobiales bacterium]
MPLQVTGTNLDVGAALREYATDRVESAIAKYVDGAISGHVRVERTRIGFATRCSVQLSWGLILQSEGEASDAHASVDEAVERLDKRMRRHKRRLVGRHHAAPKPGQVGSQQAVDYVLKAEPEADNEPAAVEAGPAIIAEVQTLVITHSVSDAVMALELGEAPCLVFRNAATDRLNVVYRRADGNIGWIDPK